MATAENKGVPLYALYDKDAFEALASKPEIIDGLVPHISRDEISSLFWLRVNNLIESSKITKAHISELLGIRPDVLSRWIQKGTMPKGDQVFIIAKQLKTSVEFLITGIHQEDKVISDRRHRFKQWVCEMPEEELESIENLFRFLRNYGDRLGPK